MFEQLRNGIVNLRETHFFFVLLKIRSTFPSPIETSVQPTSFQKNLKSFIFINNSTVFSYPH